MRIAVIGTGVFGRTLAQALQRAGHDVAVGTRDPGETSQREDWVGVDVPLQQLAVVAGDAELVVNATNGGASLAALGEVGSDHLAGKVLLDVSNPLDFSQGFPPTLSVKDTDSLAEQIQRAFPDAKVVKALNTVTVSVAVDPGLVGNGDTTVFAASDDAEAREVVVGTRDPTQTRRREDWLAADDITLDTFAEAAAGGEVIVNATNGAASLSVLGDAGVDNLAGKVVLDVANPLDFSQGFPPTLSVKDTDSLAEQIQRAFPEARVVKSLNTMNAAVMVAPDSVGDGDTSVFVAGDDDAARAVVVGLLRDLGWRDIIDLGDLSGARGVEMWLPLWLRLMTTVGGATFNLRIVR